ncbi:MAG: hypothetical protein LBS83_01185 [Holosporales bacterium]|jgi:hypothetical protein|nr:hypothetical protein [Holosporales bacterium]
MTRKYRINNARINKRLIGDEIELEIIIKKKMNKTLKKANIRSKKQGVSKIDLLIAEFRQFKFTQEKFNDEQRKFNKEQSELLQKVIKLNNLKTK